MVAEIETVTQNRHFLSKLAAAKVDSVAGTILAATVAKAGVPAIGKFVYLDKQGAITRDPKQGDKKVAVWTDEKTLDTLMAAAKDCGPRFKVREDHNDLIESRIGYCWNFQRTAPDVVSTDIKVFDKFRNRDLLFETAIETPDLIGLSIDPGMLEFELGEKDGKTIALMRVTNLEAVDVVDAGAITPGGLLQKADAVDTDPVSKISPDNPETQPDKKMAAPTLEELMAQMKTLGDTVGGLAASIKSCNDAVSAMKSAGAPPAAASDPAMKAEVDGLKTQLAETKTQFATMKRERALMGFRGTSSERSALASASVEDIEKASNEAKGYLELVDAHVAEHKCRRSEAHAFVMSNHSEAYREHLMSKGIFDPSKAVASDKMAKK